MDQLDPLLDALARAEVPDALSAIEPIVMTGIAARRETVVRRRALSAVGVAALGIGVIGAAMPLHGEPRAEMSLTAPLTLAPSHLLAVDL